MIRAIGGVGSLRCRQRTTYSSSRIDGHSYIPAGCRPADRSPCLSGSSHLKVSGLQKSLLLGYASRSDGSVVQLRLASANGMTNPSSSLAQRHEIFLDLPRTMEDFYGKGGFETPPWRHWLFKLSAMTGAQSFNAGNWTPRKRQTVRLVLATFRRNFRRFPRPW